MLTTSAYRVLLACPSNPTYGGAIVPQEKADANATETEKEEQIWGYGPNLGPGSPGADPAGTGEQPHPSGGKPSGSTGALPEVEAEDEYGEDRPTYVYLIHDPVTGSHKIGQSINPMSRLQHLSSARRGLKLVSTFVTDDPIWAERYFHEVFSHCRLRGEWFLMSKEEVEMFRGIGDVNTVSDVPQWAVELRDRNQAINFSSSCSDPNADVAFGVKRMAVIDADGNPVQITPKGRPKLKDDQRKRQATTSLTPDLYRVAVSLGGGRGVYRGLQVALEMAAGVRE